MLINNAGYGLEGAFEEVPMTDIRRQFETNVFGAVRLTQLVVPPMRAQGRGVIVNMSSMGGVLTFPGGGAYHASKYALEAFSDALRFELKGFGIDVVVIQPGLVRTGFGRAAHDRLRGRLLEAARTAADYRLYALKTTPPKPGMLRVEAGTGSSIAIEVWTLSAAAFGKFVAAIPPPLGIGTVRLADGRGVKGFVVEPVAIDGARDISSFGGWRAFVAEAAAG